MDIFRLKYGKAKARETWKDEFNINKDFSKISHRILTDVTGTAYREIFTIVE